LSYKELRTKLLLGLFIITSLVIIAIEFYHYNVREKILYDVSIQKLLILTKTIRNIEKAQKKLYDARFQKVQGNIQVIDALIEKRVTKLSSVALPMFHYFLNSASSLENIKIYDKEKSLFFDFTKKYQSKQNDLLLHVEQTRENDNGYVKTDNGFYYNSLIYPLKKENEIIGYLEFSLKADNLYRLSSKAGRYKYALYLQNSNDANSSRTIGQLIAKNSKMFKNLNLNQELIYKYANQNKIIKYNDKYYLLHQFDIERPFQKNFAQIIMASDTTQFVQENKRTLTYSLWLSISMLFILLFIIYLLLTKLINKLVKEETELKRSQAQMQVVINTSDNLIALFDNGKLVLVNSTFLSFTNFDNLKTLIQEEFILSNLFIKDKDTFSIDNAYSNMEWIRASLLLKDEEKIVAIKNKEQSKSYFNIKVTTPKNNTNSHVVIFSNISSIYKKSKKDEYLAYHDSLTNIYNREYFNEAVHQILLDSKTKKSTATLLMLDLDLFKRVNDTYGHQVGDEVLIKFTQVISKNIRITDVFARWGGEEFVLLLNDTPQETALIVANSIREKIKHTHFSQVKTITCSIGLSEYKKEESTEEWIKRVDNALYKAKENGRDRVEAE